MIDFCTYWMPKYLPTLLRSRNSVLWNWTSKASEELGQRVSNYPFILREVYVWFAIQYGLRPFWCTILIFVSKCIKHHGCMYCYYQIHNIISFSVVYWRRKNKNKIQVQLDRSSTQLYEKDKFIQRNFATDHSIILRIGVLRIKQGIGTRIMDTG